jgi:Sugar-transfer associated ATP-grasp
MSLDAATDIALRDRLEKPPSLAGRDKLEAVTRAVRSRGGTLPIDSILAPLFGPGKLTIDEALYFGLYRGGVGKDAARRFVGKRQQSKFHFHCNDTTWYAAAHDKLLFYTVLAGAGLPTPHTRAVSGEKPRAGAWQSLRSKDEVAAFLMQNRHWPLFLKPIDGIFSIGAMKVTGAADGGAQIFGNGEVPVESLVNYMEALSSVGYLFQDCLKPAPFAAEAFGDIVPSVRLLVLFAGAEPVVESAVIKIPSGQNVADNYWRGANMMGALELESGTITRVISGFEPELLEHEMHPVTGARLAGLAIPGFDEVCRTALEAASIFPGVRTQSWDVALTPAGPVLLEFNFGGDLNLHQLAHRRGALTERFVAHLRRCGYQGKLA